MDHAALITFFHWFLVALGVIFLILTVMAFTALGSTSESYDDTPSTGGGH